MPLFPSHSPYIPLTTHRLHPLVQNPFPDHLNLSLTPCGYIFFPYCRFQKVSDPMLWDLAFLLFFQRSETN